MKKILLVVAIFIAGVSFNDAKAQEKPMSIDATLGLPMGDADDFSTFFIGVNFTYMFAELAEDFYLGARAGYNLYLGEEVTVFGETVSSPDIDFLTIAAVGRYDFTENIFGRLDVGYAVGLEDNTDGAMFIEPRVGYFAESFDVFAFYQNIFDSDTSFGALGVGFAFKF